MKTSIVLLLCLFLGIGQLAAQENIEEGSKIFKSRCSSCHRIDKKLIGPALSGVQERRDKQWIIDFVHSSQTLIHSGDSAAIALFEEFNRTVMPDHKDLTAVQIQHVVAYIADQSQQVDVKADGDWYKPALKKPYTDKNSFIDRVVYLNFDGDHRPLQKGDMGSWLVICLGIILLIFTCYALVYLNHLRQLVRRITSLKYSNQYLKKDENND